jgi:hypothetical protein
MQETLSVATGVHAAWHSVHEQFFFLQDTDNGKTLAHFYCLLTGLAEPQSLFWLALKLSSSQALSSLKEAFLILTASSASQSDSAF